MEELCSIWQTKRIYIYEYTKRTRYNFNSIRPKLYRTEEVTMTLSIKRKKDYRNGDSLFFLDFGDSLFTMFFNQFVYIGVSKLFCLGKACASRFSCLN